LGFKHEPVTSMHCSDSLACDSVIWMLFIDSKFLSNIIAQRKGLMQVICQYTRIQEDLVVIHSSISGHSSYAREFSAWD